MTLKKRGILVFIICLVLLISAVLIIMQEKVQPHQQSNGNLSAEGAEDPRILAKAYMKDWQIKKILGETGKETLGEDQILPISKDQALSYLSQKDILQNNQYYQEHWGVKLDRNLVQENKMLDGLHAYLGIWMLMRENMFELYSEPIDQNTYYSIVNLVGYDTAPNGICLVRYRKADNKIEILSAALANSDLTMYGIYLGVISNEFTCFGLIKQTQMKPDASGRKESEVSSVKIELKDGSQFSFEVSKLPYYFILTWENKSKIQEITLLGTDGLELEKISEEQIEYFDCDKIK